MTLETGDQLGPYVIVGPLGTGGMGEVFKARDTRLNRFVAIKVVAAHLGERIEPRQRFVAEARAIAALNHPHICALYDTGRANGQEFIVLEYLEGETLHHRLGRGSVPLRDVVGWAIEIALALDYAHRSGIVHRDLKPSNVFLTRSGAKLMDFGLAAMAAGSDGGIAPFNTAPVDITEDGALVGTLHYLAPERLEGAPADARSDIFAFGVLLYEMTAGRRPFEEPTRAGLISAILTKEPPPLEGTREAPGELRTLIKSCLVKRPDERWQSMADAAAVLRSVAAHPEGGSPEPGPRHQRYRRWLPLVSASAVALLALAGWLYSRIGAAPTSQPSVVRFSVPPPAGGTMGLTDSTIKAAQFALAPDGHALVFVGSENGVRRLYVRPTESSEPRALDGTVGASYPFWSPDSRRIAFFADSQLKRISLDGGPVEVISDRNNGRGGSWNEEGLIVFSPSNTSPLHVVSASGGKSVAMAPLPPGHEGHRFPQFLPDGRHVLFLVRSVDPAVAGIYVTSLDDPTVSRQLRPASSNGLYASGALLYLIDGALVAQPFDADSLQLSGEPLALNLPVTASTNFYSAFSVSRTDMLATWSGESSGMLTWHNRGGDRQETVAPPGHYVDFKISPDGRRLAFAQVASQRSGPDLWLMEFARPAPVPLTSALKTDASPVWAPDGSRLVFRSNRWGLNNLFEHPGHAGGRDQILFTYEDLGMYPTDWSADGGHIVYHARRGNSGYDIFQFDIAKRTSRILVDGDFDDVQGQLSRDGRLAYTSGEPGNLNVYVRSLDNPDRIERISEKNGSDPRWRQDGRELFFIDGEGQLMSAEMSPTSLRPLRITPLFRTDLLVADSPYASGFQPDPRSDRFLIRVPLNALESSPLTVTINWTRRLDARE